MNAMKRIVVKMLCLFFALPFAAFAEPGIDLDLANMSDTVVYSQLYYMLALPEDYLGQRVSVRGNLAYYQDPETLREYFAVLVSDATACCAQGVEFRWAGEHQYPEDYPELGTEITVVGTFGVYDEDGSRFIELTDAEVEW